MGGGLGGGGGGDGSGLGGGRGGDGKSGGFGGLGFIFCTLLPLTASCIGTHAAGTASRGDVDTQLENCCTVASSEVKVQDKADACGNAAHAVASNKEKANGSTVATADGDSSSHLAWASSTASV